MYIVGANGKDKSDRKYQSEVDVRRNLWSTIEEKKKPHTKFALPKLLSLYINGLIFISPVP